MSRKNIVKPLIPHLFPSLPLVLPLSVRPRPSRPPCIPFFRDETHTIPTKRLYRHLLRATYRFPIAADPVRPLIGTSTINQNPSRGLIGVRLRIIRDWHRRRGCTSLSQTSTFLSTQSTLLSKLISTPNSSPDYPPLLSLDFSLHLSHTRRLARLAYSESSRQASLSRPAHLTGGFLRPSHFNPPLPRLRPQPIGISMMIHKRLRMRERLYAERQIWDGYTKDMAAEVQLWKDLGMDENREDGVGRWEGSGWALGTKELVRDCDKGWGEYERRKGMKFGKGLIRRVKRAKVRREGWWRDRAAAGVQVNDDGGDQLGKGLTGMTGKENHDVL